MDLEYDETTREKREEIERRYSGCDQTKHFTLGNVKGRVVSAIFLV